MERWRWAGPGGAHVVQRSRAGRCPGTVGRDKTVSFMLLCRAGAGVRLKGCALVPQLSYTRGPGARARYRPIQGGHVRRRRREAVPRGRYRTSTRGTRRLHSETL